MHPSIVGFLENQECASICCSNEEGLPHCFICFYAFNPDEYLLYFKSSPASIHMKQFRIKAFAAGTILPDKVRIYAPKGLQFCGLHLPNTHPLTKEASFRYHLKYPLAIGVQGEVATIRLDEIKMTQGGPGAGNKINWRRTERIKDLS